MKTYWLNEKEFRPPLARITVPCSKTQVECNIDQTNCGTSDDRRVYSPVTFQDVARRSIASSPVKTSAHRGTFNYAIQL